MLGRQHALLHSSGACVCVCWCLDPATCLLVVLLQHVLVDVWLGWLVSICSTSTAGPSRKKALQCLQQQLQQHRLSAPRVGINPPASVMQSNCDVGRIVAGVKEGYMCVLFLGWGLHRPADPLAVLVLLLLQGYLQFPPESGGRWFFVGMRVRELPRACMHACSACTRSCARASMCAYVLSLHIGKCRVPCAKVARIAGWSAWCALCMGRVGFLNTGKAGSRVVCTATTAQYGGGTCAGTAVQ